MLIQKRDISVEEWFRFLDVPMSKEFLNFDLALTVAAFKTCVRVIAETLATVPCVLYRQTASGGKVRAFEEPEYDILKSIVNSWGQTAVLFWETLLISAATTGNGYAWIERQTKGPGAGRVKGLWNIHPENVRVKRSGAMLFYEVWPNGAPNEQYVNDKFEYQGGVRPIVLFPGEMLHLANFSQNGITGMSPLTFHKETIQTARKQGSWIDNFFGQGIMPRGLLTTTQDIEEEDAKEITATWNSSENVKKTMLLPFGLDYKPVTMKASDVEIAAQYNLTERQICGIMRVPLAFVQNHENSTYSNAEQFDLDLIKHCIRPWAERLEQVIESQILTVDQRKRGVFCKFKLDALYRGDLLKRAQAQNIQVMSGVKTRNEVRIEEDMDPIDGLDDPLVPLNMTTPDLLAEAQKEQPSESGPNMTPSVADPKQPRAMHWNVIPLSWLKRMERRIEIAEQRQEIVEGSVVNTVEKPVNTDVIHLRNRLLTHEYRKIQEKERAEVITAAGKMTLAEFDGWLKKFTVKQEQYFRKNLTPILQDVMAVLDEDAVADEAKKYAQNMQARLRALVTEVQNWSEFPLMVDEHYEGVAEWRKDAPVMLIKTIERRSA